MSEYLGCCRQCPITFFWASSGQPTVVPPQPGAPGGDGGARRPAVRPWRECNALSLQRLPGGIYTFFLFVYLFILFPLLLFFVPI